MESTETTHLFCGKSVYEAIRFNGSKEILEDTESASDNFRYYTIDPVCMNIRLCIFWSLWAALIAVLIVSILFYCCVSPKTCFNSENVVTVNMTNI